VFYKCNKFNKYINRILFRDMPTGCNEQTFHKWYPNILALRYLKAVGKLTPETEEEIKQYIDAGFQKILQIVRNDGSFSFWENLDENGVPAKSNVWLTAYISKLIIMSRDYVKNNQVENVLINALDFIKNQQTSEGRFQDDSVYYQDEVVDSKSMDFKFHSSSKILFLITFKKITFRFYFDRLHLDHFA
jgi:A-macroglobulin TED domain